MPQNGLLVAAPTDPSAKWPEDDAAVLREAGAKERNIPYCAGWARRFFARFPGRSRRDLGRAEIETFPAEAAAYPGVSSRQACDALELYYAKFCGISLEPRNAVAEANHSNRPPNESAHIQTVAISYAKHDITVNAERRNPSNRMAHVTG